MEGGQPAVGAPSTAGAAARAALSSGPLGYTETLGIAPQAEHIRWTIAASGSIVLARAAFDAAVKELPHECFPLRNRIMLMSEYPQKNNWRRASVFFVRLERG